jgi:hypothetical protein
MFMLPTLTALASRAYSTRVGRVIRASGGTQVAPLAKKGSPLTTNWKRSPPWSSGVRSRRSVRRPIRRTHVSIGLRPARLGDEGALVHQAGAEGQTRRGIGRAHGARRHIERHAAVRAMDLPHLDRLEARILADLDADAAPDAAGDQRGGPVPAELARHLADPPATGRFASAGPVGQGVRRLVLRQVVQRRVEADSERVDVLAQPPAEIEAPAAVHVVGVPDHLAVDHHRRQRVEPVAAQHDIGLRRASGRVELPLVDPSLAADPLQIRLMVAQEGVGNEARRHQVGVDAAGHAGRHPLLLRHRAYPPAPIEVDQLHLRSYLRISRCR